MRAGASSARSSWTPRPTRRGRSAPGARSRPSSEDLLRISAEDGHTRLVRVQHAAAERRAEQIAGHVDHAAVLADLGLDAREVSAERWATR